MLKSKKSIYFSLKFPAFPSVVFELLLICLICLNGMLWIRERFQLVRKVSSNKPKDIKKHGGLDVGCVGRKQNAKHLFSECLQKVSF